MLRFIMFNINVLFPSLMLQVLVSEKRVTLLFLQDCFLRKPAKPCTAVHHIDMASPAKSPPWPTWMKFSAFYIYFLIHSAWIYYVVTHLFPELCPLRGF